MKQKQSSSSIRKKYNKVIDYLLIEWNIEVHEINGIDNFFYCPDLNQIELQKQAQLKTKLFALLHEAGHALLRKDKKNKYKKYFLYSSNKLTQINMVQTLSEEVLAWYIGYSLGKKLKLGIPWKEYSRHMNSSIWSYVEDLYERKNRFNF